MRSMVDCGWVAVVYGLATRPKPFICLKIMTVRGDGKQDKWRDS